MSNFSTNPKHASSPKRESTYNSRFKILVTKLLNTGKQNLKEKNKKIRIRRKS